MAYLALILMVAVCALAWAKGERAERAGAILLFSTWAGSNLLRNIVGHLSLGGVEEIKATLSLAGDFVLAVGLLVLAVRYSSLWLGAVLLIQGGEMTLHSMFLEQESGTLAYITVSNLLSYMFLAVILAGTAASWRRRVVRRWAQGAAHTPDRLPGLSAHPAPTLSPAS